MATSGTFTWSLDVAEIIEEAYAHCDIELRTGWQLKTARRSLDMLLTEWVNDGVNLWLMDQLTVSLTTGSQSYTLDPKYVDLIDAVTRDASNLDTENFRITMSEYLNRPNKATTGRPVQHTLERNGTGGHTLYVWPTAEDNTYSFVAWAIRYAEDIGAYGNTVDTPRRFIPALIYGLAYRLSLKNPKEVDPGLRAELKGLYNQVYAKAQEEDRERTSLFLIPAKPGNY